MRQLLKAQEGISRQNHLTTQWRYSPRHLLEMIHLQRQSIQDGSHRLNFGHEGSSQPTAYNANGQPERLGQRELVWDALGRLIEVREESRQLARYQYDHRGLRIGKQVEKQTTQTTTTHTLYDESRQPLAELNAQGRITRQYLWLADMPLAVIDTPQGQALALEAPGLIQIWADVRSAISSWLGTDAGIAWLHTNHLGAPEAATNAQGQLVWRASYAPFGAAQTTNQGGFTLHLRLPGQVWDEETGLHYNRQRYYDPELGQYLTPDPLGTPDGPNPYAYVAFNPLTNIDPDGLVLFAFDGTGNSDKMDDPAMAGGSLSNVVEFSGRYGDGRARYVTGVGTVHEDVDYEPIVPDDYAQDKLLDYLTGDDPLYVNDMGGNYSGPARIDRMELYIRDEADSFDDKKVMDIDIVGFSRGAAQARDFANRVTRASVILDGKTYYNYKNKDNQDTCQWVNFRFMGLFDTVLSTNFSGTSYNLGIPSQFSYVAQAVALNEHRSGNILSYGQRVPLPYSQHWGGFPLESLDASKSSAGAIRIEQGFLGSHADIGGGFADNGLSKVALAWMIEQATTAGVKMDNSPITIASSVVLHDKSNNIQTGKPEDTCALCTGGEDRAINGAVSGTTQRNMGFGAVSASMAYADTGQFITYQDRSTLARYTTQDVDAGTPRSFVDKIKTDVTGNVDVDGYVAWLKLNGYELNQLQVQ